MCGIYGNTSPDIFFKLYKLNQSRGNYSSGFLFTANGRYEIQKTTKDVKYFSYPFDEQYCLGHNRAPTTDENGKGLSGCHPFSFGRAIAAHNGIISNTNDLEKIHNIKFAVDSQWIPFLYNHYLNSHMHFSPDAAFRHTLEDLKGTYGIWLYDIDEEIIFVARGDNTVYWNDEKTSFSSIKNNMHKNLMPEGAIYKRQNNKPFEDINADRRLKRDQKYFII